MIVLAFCFISSSSPVILNFNVEFLLQKSSQLIPSVALQGNSFLIASAYLSIY